jgi:pimeloyl-ACP methyl ester carboxylesterase
MGRPLVIPVDEGQQIGADLHVSDRATGLVVFAHGSGSSRFSSRNRAVAEALHARGFGTLLLDLLTRQEEAIDVHTAEFRFDIPRLGRRVGTAINWLAEETPLARLPLGCFGASTGAAAALIAAADHPSLVRAVVSRGGRPDLADDALTVVTAPTLLIVGGSDEPVIEMNRSAMARMRNARVELAIVSGATHLFEEPGTLERVEELAGDWFLEHLVGSRP